jgi:NAD(P)-dependent dehydrogenase (short-subunit alcohol dehydrogenase family)
MDLGIERRVAVVTGADSGIGLATAKILASEGCTVVLTDRTEATLQAAAEEVRHEARRGAGVLALSADLTDAHAVDELAATIKRRIGCVHILAHFAGSRGAAGDFLTLSDEDWLETIQIDLMAAVRVCRAFIPHMLDESWGRVLLTASENAVQPYPEETPYNSCKAGIITLAKGLSKAYSGRGVLINVISPAFIETPMTDAMMKSLAEERGTSVDDAVKWFLEHNRPGITLGRRGRPEEVAVVAALMVSELASFVNGCNWRVDGGSVQTAF